MIRRFVLRRVLVYRWRLARRIAPVPIMEDTCPDRETFVVQRSKRGVRPAYRITVPLDELDINYGYEPPRFYGYDTTAYSGGHRTTTIRGSART